jgi:hypothetical protein
VLGRDPFPTIKKLWIVMSRDDVRRLMSESFAGSEFRRSVFE